MTVNPDRDLYVDPRGLVHRRVNDQVILPDVCDLDNELWPCRAVRAADNEPALLSPDPADTDPRLAYERDAAESMLPREGDETVACSECGHLHYLPAPRRYGPCPIDGCRCDPPAELRALPAAGDELDLRAQWGDR